MSSTSDTLGKYQIIREIARSNDIVYEAYDPAMNRRVAVKELMFPSGGTQAQLDERLKRFQREAKAAGSLIHPNIVTIYEVGDEGGRHYIAMEYLEGRNLRERLDADGSIPQEEAVKIMDQVLDALQYAHQHGVIHRDIKPDNIQILTDGRVKLTDFGIARLTFEQSITIDGQVFGTPSYMSPEQVVGRDLDARTDIFGCGVVLYEMLTGAKPFTGDSVVTITYNICNTEAAAPPGVHHSVEMVIRKALEKSVSLRYGSASEMKSALDEAVRQPMDLAPTYGPSPYIPQGAIPGIVPPQPNLNTGPPPYTGQVPPPYLGPSPTGAYPPQYSPPQIIPTYLPPRPRKPLLSPKAKQTLGTVLITFLVGAAVVGIVAGAIIGIGRYTEAQSQRAHDEQYASYLKQAQAVSDADPDRAIDIMNQLDAQAQTQEYKDKIRRSRAVFYEKSGNIHANRGEYDHAEGMYRSASEDDPTNPAYDTDTGKLLELRAQQTHEAPAWRQFVADAAEAWERAAAKAKDEAVARYANHAAELRIAAGRSFEKDGMREQAAEQYKRAYEIAEIGSAIQNEARRNFDRAMGG